MDAPPIQYCRTSDGVNIAYYAIGEGPARVYMPSIPFRHIQKQWELMTLDRRIAQLSVDKGERIVQFDPRGMGSSSPVESFDLDGFVADLGAVVAALDLATFDLIALAYSTPIAIAYAARYPASVSRLVLVVPFVDGAKVLDTPTGRAVRAMRGQDWEIYARTVPQIAFGWSQAEIASQNQTEFASQMSMVLREAIRPDDLASIMNAVEGFDVSDALERVRAHTLVVYNGNELIPREHSRAVAAGISEAQFVVSPPGQELVIIGRYLGLLDDDSPTAEGQAAASSTAIILFVDIADSTALTERLGDAAFREKARRLDEALRRAITSNGGTAIDGKLLGDGVLATFGAAREAIACALACHAAATNVDLALHAGVHAGDVIREDDNVYGGAVNIASRVADEAAAGETLVSATVRELARTSAGVTFEDRGEHELKGVGEPVRVFTVQEN